MITIGATFDKMLKQRIFMLFNGNRGVTHTYDLTISTDKSQYEYGESVIVEGTLSRDSSPLEGVAIYVYCDDALKGTAITDSNGVFTKPITNLGAGSHSIKVFYGSTESNTVTISTNKVATTLNIDVPLNLVYSDDFLITGTLTSATGDTMSSKSVKLKVGSTVVDTQTTNNSGVVNFTQTPVSMGNHTFQLVFDGDDTYANANSQTVTRSINKETTVLTLSSPNNNATIYSDGSITVSGTLVTDDNENISGKSIVVKEGNTTLATYTTDSNGAFSGTISNFSTGSHSIRIAFIEDANYTGSYLDRTIIVNSPTLSLTSSKDIITGGETTTLTATYTGAVKNGRTVTFKIGSTTLGTSTTNSNGVATYTYTGGYVGATTITAECNSVQGTYVIYDSLFADVGVTGNHNTNWWNTQSTGITITTDSNGTTVANTNTSDYSRDYAYDGGTLPTIWAEIMEYLKLYHMPIALEFTLLSNNNGSNGVFFAGDIDKWYSFATLNANNGDKIKITLDGTNMKAYVNGTLKDSSTFSFTKTSFAFIVYGQSSLKYRDLCIYQYPSDPRVGLYADKDVITSNQTSTITAKLRNYNGVASKTLNYTIKKGSTTISSGTKTTDSKGECTITYTGTAIGEVNVEVNYGTSLQGIYKILDAFFYDKAISTDYNNNWTNEDYTVSRDTTGTTIADNKTSGWTNYSSPYIPFPTTGKTIIEFDIVSYNGNVYFQLTDSTGPNFDSNLYNTAPYHVKMEITASTIIRTINDSSTTFTTSDYMDGTDFKFMFAQNTSGRWLKYSNFKIYSI